MSRSPSAFPTGPPIALVLGVDRFMSEARAITNVIGNAVAAVVIAKSERGFTPTGVARIDSGFSYPSCRARS